MEELIRAGEKSWYLDGPTKVGFYEREPGSVYLIDTGANKDAGKKMRKVLEGKGWTPKGILLTHSHADHIGGGAYLQAQYGCKAFSDGIEAVACRATYLESTYLFGGFPYSALRHRFLKAEPVAVSPFTDPDFPAEVQILPLPGHNFDMVGFLLPDGTAFIGDALNSAEGLEKYKIPFLFDLAACFETLEGLKTLDAALFVPAHAPVCTDLAALCDLNRDRYLLNCDMIVNELAEPLSTAELIRRLFTRFEIRFSAEQEVLIGFTARSYLSYLKDQDRVGTLLGNNEVLWVKK